MPRVPDSAGTSQSGKTAVWKTVGCGWNVNGVLEVVDDSGEIDTPSAEEVVLGMQPEELSEEKGGCGMKGWMRLRGSDADEKLH